MVHESLKSQQDDPKTNRFDCVLENVHILGPVEGIYRVFKNEKTYKLTEFEATEYSCDPNYDCNHYICWYKVGA